MHLKSFFTSLLLLLLLIMLTLKMKLIFGWSPDLLFAFLVALGFTAGLADTFFLAAFAAWIMNYLPYPAPDTLFIFCAALAAYALKRFAPWRPWLSLILIVAGGLGIRYLFIPGAWSTYPLWLSLDILLALGVVFLFAELLESFYSKAT